MRKKLALLALGLLLIGGAVGGAVAADVGGDLDETPKGTLSVAELLEHPVYESEVTIYGRVSSLGEVLCPCFELTSGSQTVWVWYDLMVENGIQNPPVSVRDINNGDDIFVTGQLKGDGSFWATAIVPRGPMVEVWAPIESIEVLILESFPPQYSVRVVSGLPNTCVVFSGYNVIRHGDTIRVEVVNLEPADGGTSCAELYRIIEHYISIGSDFVPGKSYTIVVNDVTEAFIAQ